MTDLPQRNPLDSPSIALRFVRTLAAALVRVVETLVLIRMHGRG
jgi:hypothetical protein